MLRKQFKIGERGVGADFSPYIIAEIGSNFNQSLDVAKRMIADAAKSGADAVKFQLFRSEQLYPDGDELHDLFKSIELNQEWVPLLFEYATSCGVHFFASPFDADSLQVLESAGVNCYKVASSEVTNHQLLYKIAAKQKPLLISTGMCDMIDVEEAVSICLAAGNDQIALLQCHAVYPLPEKLANLAVIRTFTNRFFCPVGFSDHTLGATTAIAAVGLGAVVIEKHITLDRSSDGPDHSFAMEIDEFKAFTNNIHEAYLALGSCEKEMLPLEKEVGRREGLYCCRDIATGDYVRNEDIVVRRPALGLRSRYHGMIIGMRAKRAIKKGEPVTWSSLDV